MPVYHESLASLSESNRISSLPQRASRLADALEASFGISFSVYDGDGATLAYAPPAMPRGNVELRAELAKQVAQRREAAAIEEEGSLLTVAIPQIEPDGSALVGLATFVTSNARLDEEAPSAARLLDMDETSARIWLGKQPVWPPEALMRMARLATDRLAADQRTNRLRSEVAALSQNISSTYEEISLLYRLTQNLSLAINDEKLNRIALDWLSATLPIQGIAALLLPPPNLSPTNREARREPLLLTEGEWPLSLPQLNDLLNTVGAREARRPIVLNQLVTLRETWRFPAVQQLIVVSLCEGSRCFGYLVAVNHSSGKELGTVEANLLASVASILGIHCGNSDLYRRRAELLTGIVRALTSAIDAKDPYTCGHSDRVARVAERIAKHLGLDPRTLNTIYLSGLLHDIGKIGINDDVLRKPGPLTPAEFEHIKTHPELGYKILVDLNELDEVLPVVLHHHENWDGKGYPHGLVGEDTPLLARIVAVADAFDAMGSDRPYRPGMPDEKVDAILRAGAGKQWDAKVIEAFFAVREDIREIARREREALEIDLQQWL
ncbi:MAG: HD-GYP domain-containing protein [Planctomycetota bacterium]|nr:MAG: HD-GYP domain-containing protein [Planctomycetota bacterium]